MKYDCIMIVVSEVLTADSNSNNGWIGGTDASTEVSRSVSLGYMIMIFRGPGPGQTQHSSPLQTGGLVSFLSLFPDHNFPNKLLNMYSGGGGQPAGGAVQNCMQMRHADGKWDDVSCSGSKEYFVCKK